LQQIINLNNINLIFHQYYCQELKNRNFFYFNFLIFFIHFIIFLAFINLVTIILEQENLSEEYLLPVIMESQFYDIIT
jgi:hypothetical protein